MKKTVLNNFMGVMDKLKQLKKNRLSLINSKKSFYKDLYVRVMTVRSTISDMISGQGRIFSSIDSLRFTSPLSPAPVSMLIKKQKN